MIGDQKVRYETYAAIANTAITKLKKVTNKKTSNPPPTHNTQSN